MFVYLTSFICFGCCKAFSLHPYSLGLCYLLCHLLRDQTLPLNKPIQAWLGMSNHNSCNALTKQLSSAWKDECLLLMTFHTRLLLEGGRLEKSKLAYHSRDWMNSSTLNVLFCRVTSSARRVVCLQFCAHLEESSPQMTR